MRSAERRKVNVLEMKFLRNLVGVSRMDRVRNEEVRRNNDFFFHSTGLLLMQALINLKNYMTNNNNNNFKKLLHQRGLHYVTVLINFIF